MKIAHIADIQVRAHSRHEEFEESFEHLYRSLQEQKPDRIVLAGDIVHNKTNISPELVHVVSNLLRELCAIAPVDMILGNHDLAMKNYSRMDALYPIVDALQLPNLGFHRYTTIVPIGENMQYIVLSCIDSEKEWRQHINLRMRERVSIGLWHGTINGVELDNGSLLESPHGLDLFQGLDYAMLGDIHKTQILDEERRVAYPGSYPKQNYGEGEVGGYLLWDIRGKDDHDLTFIALPTVCPYYTIDLPELEDGELDLTYQPLQEKCRLRIRTKKQLNAADRAYVARWAKGCYEPVEITFVHTEENRGAVQIAESVAVENLRDEAAQERLLRNYLAPQGLTPAQLDQIVAINQECPVSNADVVRNVRYKIEQYSFSGMFSFGAEQQTVDLRQHKGIVGVFGKNAAGKSSLVVDVPLYALFNKVSKDVSKNQHYVNDRLERCSVAMNLQVHDEGHFVSRWTDLKHTKKRTGVVETSSATDLAFKIGAKSMEHEDRAKTDKHIRSIFGSAEDFMLTTVAAQFDLLGFVANKATDRKKTIARYFDLEVFEEKHKQANDTLRAMKKQVQALEAVDYENCINTAQKTLVNLNWHYDETDRQAKSARRLYEFGRQQIEKLRLQNAREESDRKVNGALVKSKYIQARDEVKGLRAELEEFDDYVCMANADCCLAQRKQAVEGRLLAAEERFETAKGDMTVLVEEINRAQAAAQPGKDKIREQERVCAECSQQERKAANELNDLTRKIAIHEQAIKGYDERRRELGRVRGRFEMQELYVKAMSKDGLSYEIIKKNLGRINEEIGAILGTDLHFNVWLEDDDKEINVYLQNEGQKPRLIELCSGMEKTVAAIAIRAALISVTTLPVSNLFILDESFTSLDVEHMDAVGRVLSGLKRIFDTVLLICHNDYVKDLCDSFLVVEKDASGFSCVKG